MASQSESQVRKTVTLVALNRVLSVVALLGTHLLVQKIGKSAGESDERSARVKNGTRRLELSRFVAKGDGVEVDLPVSLPAERNLGHWARVVVLVDTTENGLGLRLLVIGVAKVEGEDGLVKKALLDSGVEGRDDAVDTDGVVAETQDTVETAKGKGKTRLRGSFTEELVFDLEVTDLDSVLGDVTLYGTRAVSDGKVRAILLVRRRITVVVLLVEVASDGAAVGGWDP